MIHEPVFAARIAGRLDGFFAPLQEALGVGEGAFLFGVAGGGKKKYFGADFFGFQFAAFDLRRFVPEGGGFGFDHLADDQPFQFAKGATFHAGVRAGDSGVLAHDEEAIDFAVEHVEKIALMRVIAGYAGDPVKAIFVFFGGGFAVIGFEQADDVFVDVVPPAGAPAVFVDVVLESFGFVAELGHAQVARQNVVQSWNVGRALDGGVAAEGEDAATGSAHVAQEELQNCGAANDLDAGGVVGPAYGIADRGGFFGAAGFAKSLGDVEEGVFGDSTVLLDQFRSVACEVPAQNLEDTAGVLQGGVLLVFI